MDWIAIAMALPVLIFQILAVASFAEARRTTGKVHQQERKDAIFLTAAMVLVAAVMIALYPLVFKALLVMFGMEVMVGVTILNLRRPRRYRAWHSQGPDDISG